MSVYDGKVMDHFMNPRNTGEIEDADGIREEGNPVCGDMMTFYIKVNDNLLDDVKFKTFGNGTAHWLGNNRLVLGNRLLLAEKDRQAWELIGTSVQNVQRVTLTCLVTSLHFLASFVKDRP